MKCEGRRRARAAPGADGPHRARLVHLGGALERPAEALRVHDASRRPTGSAPRRSLAQGRRRRGRRGDVPRRRAEVARRAPREPARRRAARSRRAPRRSPPAPAGSTPPCSRRSTSGSSIPRGTPRRRHARRDRGRPRPARAAAASCAATPATRTRPTSGSSSICARRGRSSCTATRRLQREPLRVERGPGERQLRRALRAARSGHRRLRGRSRRWSASAPARTCSRSSIAASPSTPACGAFAAEPGEPDRRGARRRRAADAADAGTTRAATADRADDAADRAGRAASGAGDAAGRRATPGARAAARCTARPDDAMAAPRWRSRRSRSCSANERR